MSIKTCTVTAEGHAHAHVPRIPLAAHAHDPRFRHFCAPDYAHAHDPGKSTFLRMRI